MKKNKMSLTTELDLTREGTAEMTRWCILIALHQSFGVGAARLNCGSIHVWTIHVTN